ncbi:Pr6Pr family membrane protein [Spiroplasma endosymbiont of Atherix ibis]|uniref:Pr6Pr family membrane protein n=1 Tax=Spiroplasma endosymbiont of Atherix ibis TaxID=3066291 RepID=UPI0030D3B023
MNFNFYIWNTYKRSSNIGNDSSKNEPSILNIWSKDEAGKVIGYDYYGYVINFFSFFTIQSNILIVVWLLVGFFNHNKEGEIKILKKSFSLSVITYITVTAIIFNFMLLPQVLASGDNNFGALWWVEQMVVHTLGPIAAVVYFLFFMKQNLEFNFKKFIKKDFWIIAIYPVAYLIYTLSREELIYRSYGSDASLAHKHQAYQYFFLEIHNKNALGLGNESFMNNGLTWLFIAIITIVGIIIGLGSLYLFIGSKTSNIRNSWKNQNNEKKLQQAT